ncbi:MAG: hypothetical protein HY015_05825 [Bacteroidetes bacterium]|nr:hypothetical protein [Bacteroidota bacterium]MBI3482480.1 hypothetical protein [Bacteroidota bacterium]
MNQIIAALGFPAITLIFYGLGFNELRNTLQRSSFDESKKKRIFNRVLISTILWVVFVCEWSLSGMMQNFSLFPLNVAPVMIIPLIILLFVTFSKTTKEILIHVEPQAIIRLQSFRIFVELVIWLLFIEKMLPVQMTFEGRNLDILSGITAVVVAWLAANQKINKTILAIWNIACLGLLVNIVIVAILSMPTPFQYFFNEPMNMVVTKFPYVFLPAFLVPLAYMLHFFSLMQLAVKK